MTDENYNTIFPFFNNTEYIFNENIIEIIHDEIIPDLYQYDDTIEDFYKFMILSLLDKNYSYEEIYNGICFYITYISGPINRINTIENMDHIEIIKEQIINLYRRRDTIANRILNLFTLFTNIVNTPENENIEELENVKLVILKEELKKIPLMKYKDISENIKSNNILCSICQNNFKKYNKIRLLNCNHVYHQRCIDKWLLEMSHKCPICRESCGEYKPNIDT